MRAVRLIYVLTFSLVLLIGTNLLAQGLTGKLVGSVTDATTKEALIGANVMLEGTNIGAAANVEGKFIILNIPPGRYNVSASMIGYSKVTQQEVEIFIDRTTQISFQLQDESVQMEQVVVIAQRPPIVKDRTSTSTSIDDRQISAAPIEGLRGALEFQAGIQKDQKGNFSVRGSGANELNFQINGVEQTTSNTSAPATFGTEKADNSWKFDVNPLGVQQLQLITGGFSAEYGNAQAGIVKVVMKEGAPKFTGEFRAEYRPPGKYHYGNYLYDKNNWEWQKWGNLESWMARRESILRELKLDLRYEWLKNTDSVLYNQIIDREIEWAHALWVKNHEPSDDNVLGVYDYRQYSYQRYSFGFGGPLGIDHNLLKFYISGEYRRNPSRLPTPEKVQVAQNYILNLVYQPTSSHKIKLMGSYQSYIGGIWSGSSDIRWSGLAFTPPGVSTKYLVTIDPVREEQTIAQSLNWVYTISPLSFVEVLLTHQSEKYELPFKYLAGYGLEVDRADSLYDPSGTVLREGTWWEKDFFRAPFGFSTNYYQDSRTENFGIKADYTNQITEFHLLKKGFSINYWDMVNNGVNSSFQANTFVARNGFADYYRAYPYRAGLYLQDRMEFEGMIANVGLRFETYNFQARVPLDEYNYLYPGTDGPGRLGSPLTKNSETKYIVLPRLGISFPIGEATAFRLQYGHFASMPVFSEGLSNKTWVGWQGIGNPNLDPKLTINYEFGLQQQIGSDLKLDMVLYYNDRVSQIGRRNIASFTGSRNQLAGFGSDGYPLYYYFSQANNAYGSTLGFETILETFGRKNLSYRISYTISQTKAGNFGPPIIYPDDTRGYAVKDFTNEFLASWDRTHNLRALVQYFFNPGEGPELFGLKILSNSTFSFTYTVQSGTPYTYITDFNVKNIFFNRRYPLESSVDFNFIKNIEIDNIRLLLAIRIMNVFDNKWLTPMSTGEDIGLWSEQSVTVADPGNDPNRFSYLVAPYRAFSNLPRQIFFTVGFGF